VNRKRILLVAEGVSLAHIARPLELANALDPDYYDVRIASDPRYAAMVRPARGVTFHALPSISPAEWIAAAENSGATYSGETIGRYIEDELRLYDDVQPHFIVADTRWTVSTSAEHRGLPHAALVNAHWSPFAEHNVYEPIDNPVRLFARRARQKLRAARRALLGQSPPASDIDTITLNRARRRYGLKPVRDFYDFACRGDYTLYADPPGLFPMRPLPESHVFIGPVLWSPDVTRPDWWGSWDPERPVIYLTLGSTGLASSLPQIVREIATLPVTVLVSTAGRVDLGAVPPNVLASDYLPGVECAALASIVVFNGGSGTGFQAASQGAPLLGVWSNADQKQCMAVLEKAGVGLSAEAAVCTAAEVRAMAERVLADPAFKVRARELAAVFAACDARANFAAFIERVTGGQAKAAA
jgi:UDP:flavonoid glycosyltransferase YjiC (YdhE family)